MRKMNIWLAFHAWQLFKKNLLTGQMAWFEPEMVNPAATILRRKRSVLLCTICGNFDDCIRISITLLADPTTAGGNVFENKYGRDRCFSKSINSRGPVVYPPAAPPNALPNVEFIISTRPIKLKNSSVPL